MADSEFGDESEYGTSSARAVIMDAILAPFRALVPKSALRLYVNTLLFMGAANGNPWGIAHFDSEFVALQPYDVSVTLELPRTPSNLDTGNFMLDLALFSPAPPRSLTRSITAICYASVACCRFMVVGTETLEVPMMELLEFAKGARNLPQSLRLEIQSDSKMQIYTAQVEFRAKLTGLRWLMYRWKVTSFVVFSSLFWSVSMLSAGLTWLAMTWVWGTMPKNEIKEEPEDSIKEDPDDQNTSEESLEVKKEEPEEQEQRLLSSYPAEGEETGTGSGLESAEARGVQRRRSHLTQTD
ncbi:hypothetical protein PDIDSM_651 [Penicillium digitatum]|nr:hypothetical protein PDIDSM_651 [Penicillium digitatum]